MYGWVVALTYGVGVAWLFGEALRSIRLLVAALIESLRTTFDGLTAGVGGDPSGRSTAGLDVLLDAMETVAAGPTMWFAAALALAGILVFRYWEPDQPSADWGGPIQAEWVDIASIYDPVSVGGAGTEEDAISIAVVNSQRFSDLPKEHVSYFNNRRVGETIIAVVSNGPIEPALRDDSDPHTVLKRAWLWGLPFTLVIAYWMPTWVSSVVSWLLF